MWMPVSSRPDRRSRSNSPRILSRSTGCRWQGRVCSPDAAELPDTRERDRKDTRAHVMPPSGFRTLVALDSPHLERDGRRYRLNSGMLVSAEIHLGTRTVMEYLLSPVSKTLHEAGREL